MSLFTKIYVTILYYVSKTVTQNLTQKISQLDTFVHDILVNMTTECVSSFTP